jgi:hypothetical protein
MEDKKITFERLRNNIRRKLYHENSDSFPYSSRGTSLPDLADSMFYNLDINALSNNVCPSCRWRDDATDSHLPIVAYRVNQRPDSVSDYLCDLFVEKTRLNCPECAEDLFRITTYWIIPKIMLFSIGDSEVLINKLLKIRHDDTLTRLHLKGIIYLGSFHFTARVITEDGIVWFHDGRTSGKQCEYEKSLIDFHGNELNVCDGKQAVMAIYTLE